MTVIEAFALPPGLLPTIQMHAATSKGSRIYLSSTRENAACNFNIRKQMFSIIDEF